LLGGAWGAWIGFSGYLRLPHNADSFATLLASGVFVEFAAIGLVAGAVSAALTGGSAEWLLRRVGMQAAVAVSVATVVCALTLWQAAGVIQTRYPGLRASSRAELQRNPATAVPTPADTRAYSNPCAQPPPTQARERARWDEECR
jgi:hypothetical protein